MNPNTLFCSVTILCYNRLESCTHRPESFRRFFSSAIFYVIFLRKGKLKGILKRSLAIASTAVHVFCSAQSLHWSTKTPIFIGLDWLLEAFSPVHTIWSVCPLLWPLLTHSVGYKPRLPHLVPTGICHHSLLICYLCQFPVWNEATPRYRRD